MCFSKKKKNKMLIAVSNGVQEVAIILFANPSGSDYMEYLHFQCSHRSSTPGRPLLDLKIEDIISISFKTHAFAPWELIIETRMLIPALNELRIYKPYNDKTQIKKFIEAVNEVKRRLS